MAPERGAQARRLADHAQSLGQALAAVDPGVAERVQHLGLLGRQAKRLLQVAFSLGPTPGAFARGAAEVPEPPVGPPRGGVQGRVEDVGGLAVATALAQQRGIGLEHAGVGGGGLGRRADGLHRLALAAGVLQRQRQARARAGVAVRPRLERRIGAPCALGVARGGEDIAQQHLRLVELRIEVKRHAEIAEGGLILPSAREGRRPV
jgi:hypothetical protein